MKQLLVRRAIVLLAMCLQPLAFEPLMAQSAVSPGQLAATTPLGSGPYKAIMEMDSRLPDHTVYHPADIGRAGKLPIVAWGNGACWNAGDSFRWFLSDIASYGYLVIAVGPITHSRPSFPSPEMAPLPPGSTPALPAKSLNGKQPAALAPAATHSAQLIDAINWAIAENERVGSKYYHRLDPKAIATMGQSCGGAQALEAAFDPRVVTTVMWNSGLFAGATTMAGGKPLTKADLNKLHGSIAYISGDDEDLAYANANDDFDHLPKIPAFRGYGRGVLHSGTYQDRNGGEFAGVGVAWLNWQLKADDHARHMFVGPDCGLCVNPHWVVRQKNLN